MRTLKIYTTLMVMLLTLMYSNYSKAQCTSASISTSPTQQAVCAGNNTFFLVIASGTTLSYQWQVNNWLGGGWVNLSNNATYSGVNTGALVITNVTMAINTFGYRCVVQAACGPAVISNVGWIDVNLPHNVYSSPTTQTVCVGTNAVFSVGANSVSVNPISYQWQVSTNAGVTFADAPNSAPYSGVNTPNLTITTPGVGMNAYVYRCQVSSLCGSPTISGTAQLNVNVVPGVVSQPASITACPNGTTGFSVTGSATSNYQWQVSTNGGGTWANISPVAPYSGSATSNLTISNIPLSFNNNQYRCVLSGNCAPSINSNPATLTLFSQPSVSTHPLNTTTCEDGVANFSVAGSGTGINYQWQVAPANSGVYTDIANVYPYSGMQSPNLSIINTPLSFNQNTYRCVIAGTCTPVAISNAGTLTVNGKPSITGQPANFTTCDYNINGLFTVTATGAGLNYQWQTAASSSSTFSNLSNAGIYSGVNTNTLVITSGTMALQGQQYRCVVSGTCAPSTTSNAAVLNINLRPSIINNPLGLTVCEASNTSFSVTASGAGPLNYQWQISVGGGAYTNLSNAGVYSNVTTPTLNITGVTNSLHGSMYRCAVTGACTPGTESAGALLNVNALTVLSTSPLSQVICAGNSTSFSVGATGGGVNYQWQVNNGSGFTNVTNVAPYAGATAATLNVNAAPASLNGFTYRCVVNSTCGPAINSGIATLTVNTAPVIITPAATSTVCEGSATSFSVAATGTALTYQWQLNAGSGFANLSNAGIYSGVTTTTLNISTTTAAMNGFNYRVVVSGTCTPPVMASAQLNVNTAPVITLQPVNATVCAGSTTSFNVTATGTSLTYQWQVNSGFGFVNVSNGGVYSGATSNTLVLTAPSTAFNGLTYQCIVSGTCPSPVTSAVRTLTVNALPAIFSSPLSTTVCTNSPATFSVVASGAGLTYQWQIFTGGVWVNVSNGSPYSGAMSASLSILSTPLSFNGNQYRCIVGGSCAPTQTSGTAILSVNSLPFISNSPIASTVCVGGSTSFTTVATGTGVTYQWQVNTGSAWADVIPSGVYSGVNASTLTVTGATATMNTYQYRCIVGGTCAPTQTSFAAMLTVITPPTILSNPKSATVCDKATVVFNVNTTGAGGVTYQWQQLNGAVWVNIVNGGINGGATTANLSVSNIPYNLHGTQYRCVVSNGCAPAAISSTATLNVFSKPVILVPSKNDTICENTQTTFSVTVDALNPTYQWQEDKGTGWVNLTNSANYSLVNTRTLLVSNVTLAMSGYGYRCVVNSDCGSNIAGPGVLHVYPKPRITTQPRSTKQTYNETIKFWVDATGKDLTYQWQVDTMISGNVVFVNINDKPGAYAGTTTRELTVLARGGYMNLRSYRCVVSGLCSPAEISNAAKLTVIFATGIDNVTGEQFTVKVYPNPVNGATLNLQLSNYNNDQVSVKITNNLGAVVANQAVTLQNNAGVINVANLPAGMYNLHITDAANSNVQVIRFVKQ